MPVARSQTADNQPDTRSRKVGHNIDKEKQIKIRDKTKHSRLIISLCVMIWEPAGGPKGSLLQNTY